MNAVKDWHIDYLEGKTTSDQCSRIIREVILTKKSVFLALASQSNWREWVNQFYSDCKNIITVERLMLNDSLALGEFVARLKITLWYVVGDLQNRLGIRQFIPKQVVQLMLHDCMTWQNSNCHIIVHDMELYSKYKRSD